MNPTFYEFINIEYSNKEKIIMETTMTAITGKEDQGDLSTPYQALVQFYYALIKLAIRTSRIFKRMDNGWKQVHHHGSIEDPQLLEQYQSAVLGKR